MKSKTMIQNLQQIDQMRTAGDVRRVGCEMLLALARKEISATDVEAGAKMIASVSAMLHTEIKAHVAASQIRKEGGNIGRLDSIGKMLIADNAAETANA